MRKFKKSLAFAMAAAMAITAVPVNAAAAPTAKLGTSTLYANGISKYKTTYVSVTKGYTFKHSTKNTKVLTLGKTSGVQAKAAGKTRTGTAKAVVTVKIYKNKKLAATKNLNVTVKPAAYAVSVKVDNTTINLGETAQATGTMATKKASGSLRYYSSNTAVATVNAKTGKITAVAGGSTKITAVSTISRKTSSAVEVTVVADSPSATQSGVKTIKITNGVSMADRTVTVKRGNTAVALDTNGVVTSADGKEIIVTTANKLVTGEYTVVVGDKELTVAAETEKVSKIEILSDKAAIDANSNKKAYVGYQVTNQFGEDITKSTTVKVSGTDISGTKDLNSGEVTFERSSTGSDYIINRDVVSLVVMHPDSGVSTQAVLTVSDKAAIKEITFAGVYNADGKTLTQDSNNTISDYYLLFTAKDQYGRKFKDYDGVEVGTDLYVTIGGGITYLQTDLTSGKQTARKITKDGTEYIGVRMSVIAGQKLGAGTATLNVISTGTGTSINDTITVAAGAIAETITVTPPADIVAGEKAVFNYTALDASGNIVTAYDSVKDITINGNATATFTGVGTLGWRKDSSGNGVLELTPATTLNVSNDTTLSANFMTRSYKSTVVQFTVKKAAELKAIELKSDKGIYANGTEKTAIKLGDLKIEDQHGRTITDEKEMRKLLSTGTYYVGVKLVGATAAGITLTTTTTPHTDAAYTGYELVQVASTDALDKALFEFTSTITEDATIEIALFGSTSAADSMIGSKKTKTIVAAKADDITSIRVSVGGKVFAAGANHGQDLKLAGRRSGVDITIPAAEYSVNTGSSDLKATSNNVFVAATDKVSALTSADEATQKVSVFFNGDEYDCDVTLTKVEPTITSVTFDADPLLLAGSCNAASIFAASGVVKKVKDSYGVEHTFSATTGEISIGQYEKTAKAVTPLINFKSLTGTYTLANNGKNTAGLTAVANPFNGTLELIYGSQRFEIQIYQ